MNKNFAEVVRLIAREDPRFDAGAYAFVREGLDHTIRTHGARGGRRVKSAKVGHHVNGRQLCEGLRDYALEQYGPMAYTLLREWGLRSTLDFGHIVFNLIEYEVFAKNETDSPEDFADVYSFEEAFRKPFLPTTLRKREGVGLPLPTEAPDTPLS